MGKVSFGDKKKTPENFAIILRSATSIATTKSNPKNLLLMMFLSVDSRSQPRVDFLYVLETTRNYRADITFDEMYNFRYTLRYRTSLGLIPISEQ